MSTNKFKPRSHHRQPESYLRGFCDEPSFLWVYDRGKPYNPGKQKRHKFNPCRMGVRELGETDAYATVMPDGTRDFGYYESRLQKIESKTDDILRKIRSQVMISIDEKEVFAEYIQNMYWRTKKHEDDIHPLLNMIQSKLNIEHYDAQKYLKSDNGKQVLIFESMVTLHPLVHQILISMSWIFYIAESDNYFVTSSAPVVFDPAGLFNSALLFPISKNITLIATHNRKTDLEYINTSSNETLAINYYTITQAPSVYAPKEEFEVWDFLENGTRINWLATLGKLMEFRTNS